MSAIPSMAEIMGADVARLYDAKSKLQAAASNPILMSGELPTYQIILSSTKGSEQVKTLAADYIPQFLHYFPTLVESGINAQLDLVEDEKLTIRIHAIRGLEMICKSNPSTVRRIAELLSQLLVTEEGVELQCIKATFATLFAIDAQAALLALIHSVSAGEDANVRAKGLEFLTAQLKTLLPVLKKADAAVSAGVCAGLKAMLGGAQNALIGRDELRFFVQSLILLTPHGNNAAKIKADEPLKAELAAIVLTQAGLKSGSIDVSNEAALKHLLAVQSVVGNLASAYGVDTSPFLAVFFQQLLPKLEQIANAELRTSVLRAIANAARQIQPRQAQQLFPAFFAQFKTYLPTGEIVAKAPAAPAAAASSAASAPGEAAMADAAPAAAASSASSSTSPPSSPVNFAFAEVFVYLFHILAAQAPSELRAATGIFTPTGQPGDFSSAPSSLRDEFTNRVQFLLQSNAAYKEQLHTVQKKINEEIKAFAARANPKKAAAKPAAAAATSAAAAGQPAGPKPVEAAPAPVAAAAAVAAPVADESVLITTLRTQLSAVNLAVRIAASIVGLAKPLLTLPMPTFLTAEKVNLSWAQRKAGPEGKQQQQQGGKQGAQQQQQGQKGQGQQQQQQQQKKKQGGGGVNQQHQSQSSGSKRKSAGGDSSSHKKQGASQKKQGGGGGGQQQQQQGQKQGGSNKKQRQSASNKGGNQNGGNQNGGGGRRRR